MDESAEKRPHALLSHLLAPRGCGRVQPLRQAVAGKVVLLTGASFGIGAALARRLGAAGATVLLVSRSQERLLELAGEIIGAGGRAEAIPLDLADPLRIAAQADAIQRLHGGVDIVIHNAGKSIRRSLSLSLNRAHDFQRCMAINYLGPVQLQLALLPRMLARGSGHIIGVSTVGVRLPPSPRWAAYLSSKAAFDVWLGCAAPELRRSGIATTSVYLGLVHTRMSAPTPTLRKMPGQTPDEAAQVLCRALIRRLRRCGPWWLGPVSWLAWPLATPLEWLHRWLFRHSQDSPAARGNNDDVP
jgi:NAD(P)-dependent dehydrogenase (short-subunit alcohol dehydrogenase family)